MVKCLGKSNIFSAGCRESDTDLFRVFIGKLTRILNEVDKLINGFWWQWLCSEIRRISFRYI